MLPARGGAERPGLRERNAGPHAPPQWAGALVAAGLVAAGLRPRVRSARGPSGLTATPARDRAA